MGRIGDRQLTKKGEAMGKKRLQLALAFFFITLLPTVSVCAEEMEFVLGIGLASHYFAELDDLRQETSMSSDKDEIEDIRGLEIYAEYFVADPFASGVKGQSMAGRIDYIATDFTMERRVKLNNMIGYVNFLPKVGDGYCRLGFTLGYGSSKYIYSLERVCDSGASNCKNEKDKYTSDGTMAVFGFIADWGKDGSGGRIGYNLTSAEHEDIEFLDGSKQEVKASGSQLHIDFRYAF